MPEFLQVECSGYNFGSSVRDAIESSSPFQVSMPVLYWIYSSCYIDAISF